MGAVYKLCTLLLGITMHMHISSRGPAITTEPFLWKGRWTGRLGDQIFHYVRASWVAHLYDLPFIFRPFAYSEHLEVSRAHALYEEQYQSFTRKCIVKTLEEMPVIEDDVLYAIDFFFTSTECTSWEEVCYWEKMLADQAFIEKMKSTIRPLDSLAGVAWPQDRATVAVHVRKGGGFDKPLFSQQIFQPQSLQEGYVQKFPETSHADINWPLKFPPDQYYIDQIKRLHEILGGAPLYVYIFTDDPNPAALAQLYEQQLSLANVTFDYRRTTNHHTLNVLEDFFSMAKSDYLIRSASNFAQMAQLIGNHKMTIYSRSAVWQSGCLVVNDVGIYIP